MSAYEFPFFPGQVFHIDRRAVFKNNVGFFYFGEMILENSRRIVYAHRYDGTAGFFRNFKAAFMERQEGVVYFVPGTLRKNTDRNAGFYLFDAFQNRFQTLLDVFPVEKEAVEVFHPVDKEGITEHFFFCNIAGGARNADIGKQDIEVASMIAHI